MKRVVALVLVLVAVAGVFAWRRATRQRLVVAPHELTLPADGALRRAVEAQPIWAL